VSRLAAAHLRLRHGALHRALRDAVAVRKRITARLRRPEIKAVCISNEQVDQLLTQARSCCDADAPGYGARIVLTDDELRRERHLVDCASRAERRLPLRALVEDLELSDADLNAVLLCAATDMHPAYGRIVAFVQDDVRRQLPMLGLVAELTARNPDEWPDRRAALAATGKLRRIGLLCALEHRGATLTTPLSVASDLLPRLAALETSWAGRYFDADDVPLDPQIVPGRFEQAERLREIAAAIASRRIDTAGVWGATGTPLEDAVMAIATASGRRLRRWQPGQNLRRSLTVCEESDAILWVSTDALVDAAGVNHAVELEYSLRNDRVAVVFSGEYPWRPTSLLKQRAYVEVTLVGPSEARRKRQWATLAPELSEDAANDLAQRFRLTPSEQIAATRTAYAERASHNDPHDLADVLIETSRTVSQARASRFAISSIPQRSASDLVLPDVLHAQVMEIPRFFRSLGTVNEQWGFKRGNGDGIKALFTGDSGTGKTMAAEVIANEIGLPLMTLDVSQLVSKWLGETEQNIEAAFREAESSHSMMFFDEADTLFGKRGEITSGTDRYANLEVGFLLQRLERFSGLAILASNLKDEIDDAFMRRFQVLLHFPRPGREERLRLWRKAFPKQAPLDPRVDIESLLELDLTGAGIMAVAQTAALLAADEGSGTIRANHIVAGVSRQFHRESRVLGPDEMGGLESKRVRKEVVRIGEAIGG
jgi:hypothetical protein